MRVGSHRIFAFDWSYLIKVEIITSENWKVKFVESGGGGIFVCALFVGEKWRGMTV
jgi:hypothetical protein